VNPEAGIITVRKRLKKRICFIIYHLWKFCNNCSGYDLQNYIPYHNEKPEISDR
jgi:hypothetical protein